ncbi:hypothetical protein [Brevibacillus choshinensis]|uniref:hypothetical protein n=1 Tax=Brevibacillus choshinensis TaxID=54911 RepID=UPI002E1F90AA|nr:hypothetical protein [Brevibacillus choshinensis]MED4755533.1 hypothetical protein [Brevibacillus choshinensis]MED4783678.1 hypothetical protein [Brevibacillus choshinensis]
MVLLLISAAAAMTAADMPIAHTMVASRPIFVVTYSSTSCATLFAVSLATVAVHSPFPPYLY